MSDEGFIKLYRKMLNWEWYTDINTKVLFLHCLLKANYKEAKWQGVTIERGSFVTSIRHLADETGLSVRQTRTALEHLILTHEVTHRSTAKFSIITIVSYEKYQFSDTQSDTPMTRKRHTKRHTTDTLPTTREKKKKSISIPYGDRYTEKDKNPAAPSALTGKGLPPFGELNRFARTVPGSSDYIADEFYTSFELSRTAMPENWKELYKRFVSAGKDKRQEFTRAVTEGEYKERWGSY